MLADPKRRNMALNLAGVTGASQREMDYAGAGEIPSVDGAGL
jgi:hypothetical protein